MASLIVTDVDGCVTPEDSAPFDLTHLTPLIELIRGSAGKTHSLPPVTLCTGRPQPYVEVLAKLLDIRLPIICENGAVLYTLDGNWSRYAAGVTEEKVAGLRAIRAFIERDLLPNHPKARYQFGKEAMLSVYSEAHAELSRMQEAVETFAAREALPPAVINLTHFYLNISMAGVDKGTALLGLMQELGVPREEVVAIGDTVGDMPLRETADFFACPANAQDEIRAVADYVSPYPDARGLVDILRLPECQQLG
jgi:HAD superfamily hydrolase (TIGR01484 family)